MLRNVFMNVAVLLLFAIFITPKHALQCHKNQGATSNATCSSSTVGVTEHCIIQMNSTSHEWSYSCDEDRLCKGKRDDARHHVCQGEVLTSYYCCSHDLCNGEDPSVVAPYQNVTCMAGSSCSWSYCINTTIESSNGTINLSLDCFYDQTEKPNSTEPILLPSGETKKATLFDLSQTCTNLTSIPFHPTRPSIISKSTYAPSDPLGARNGFSVGVIIGAILVISTGLMLVGVGVRKCYERHLNRRLEYSYAQLTIDMLDDDDDHLILP